MKGCYDHITKQNSSVGSDICLLVDKVLKNWKELNPGKKGEFGQMNHGLCMKKSGADPM